MGKPFDEMPPERQSSALAALIRAADKLSGENKGFEVLSSSLKDYQTTQAQGKQGKPTGSGDLI